MKSRQIRTMAAILSLSMAFGIAVPSGKSNVQAATEHWNDASVQSMDWENWKDQWDTYSSNYENVSMTPGVNETELNYAWYSKTQEIPAVRIAKSEEMTGAVEFTGKQETAVEIDGTQYYSNKVTVKNLEENTQYYYQVYKNGQWTAAEKYSTKSFSSFSFLYVGDPQIGASKGQTSVEGDNMTSGNNNVSTSLENSFAARNDAYNWDKILKEALEDHEDVSFMVSAGDQVNYAKNEREYAGYLGAEALRSLPVSTTIGNHDSGSNQYTLHYNNPNAFDGTNTEYTSGKTNAGTDYYYTYGDVLFIVLDTNNYNCATHENVIKKAINENQDAKWRVVMFHQDIYGSGKDHSDSDGIVLRTQLTPIFDEYKIDVVLQGHDHTYSRTYQLTGDGQEHTKYNSSNYRSDSNFLTQNNCYVVKSDAKSGTVVNPEGTVYVEANSSTGSKFYELIATQQDYIAERSQTWTPSYSVITVDDDSFSITTYDGKTRQELRNSSTYTIVKDDTQEPGNGTQNPSTPDDNTQTPAVPDDNTQKPSTPDDKDQNTVAPDTDKDQNTAAPGTDNVEAKEQTISGASSFKKVSGSKAFYLKAKTNGNGTLSYKTSNKKVATVAANGKVTIKGIGTATITVNAAATEQYKAAKKTIKITVNPNQSIISKVTSKKKDQVTLTWKKDGKVTGYQVVYGANRGFTKNVTIVAVKKNTKTSLTLKKVKNQKVFVKVRAYKTVNGKKMYGKFSAVKSVKVK